LNASGKHSFGAYGLKLRNRRRSTESLAQEPIGAAQNIEAGEELITGEGVDMMCLKEAYDQG
jgi:hypothetical protein